ncbi:hypothetical protein SPRG_03582 [Saprolegnia parasitica CBS 223.65]|uniref:EGF-like domain-containing protein n=1 Tax=Saprolegnia parasitica (strain CBS 223.65) TaxID=695850 RepID=A0A067CMD8_SAPPC|nr:hypothetical protein SPRG_03582 [Saprolegnia parasitica CBS 223.65]KDO31663.1 hypothetical protein SPRG_03582 [Saprolegnia parasitica CBS 223.65]|eukprot:XP_012197551.1 hypothetical protein SPRG_03582 [Saprolegnia parasitica CBS 223.65]
MQLTAWMLTLAAAVAAQSSGSGSGTDAPINEVTLATQPGKCNTSKDCKTGFQCVAVESDMTGVKMLRQCVKGVVCSGNVAGACPSFSNWKPENYRLVEPVCAFAPAPNCNSAINAQGQVVQVRRSLKETATAKPGNVTCYQMTYPSVDGSDPVKVNGIYRCVDKKIYLSQSLGSTYTQKQITSCAGNASTSGGVSVNLGLCNGHGSCAPTNSFSAEYKCICSTGYSINDNCFNATGNTCDTYGQCGLGNCDIATGLCKCPVGSIGNQCSLCDPTMNNKTDVTMCNGKGSCGIDGQCVCNSGYAGANCATKVKVNSTGSSSGSKTAAPSAAVATHASIALLGAATIVAAAML